MLSKLVVAVISDISWQSTESAGSCKVNPKYANKLDILESSLHISGKCGTNPCMSMTSDVK